MASIIAGILCLLAAAVCGFVTFVNLLANAQASVTGGDAGGVSYIPPLLTIGFVALAIALFVS